MMPKTGKLFEYINLWDIGPDGMLMGCSGELGFIYSVLPSQDVTLLHDSGQEQWIRNASRLLETMPARTSMSVLVEVGASLNPHVAAIQQELNGDKVVSAILRSKLSSLGSRQRLKTIHLCLSVHPKDFLKTPLLSNFFFPKRRILSGYEELKSQLATIDGMLAIQAQGMELRLEKLGREKVLDLYWKRLNPGKAGRGIGFGGLRPWLTPRSQMAASPAEEQKEAFWLDGRYHRAVSLFALGDQIELGGVDRLIAGAPDDTILAFNFMALELEAALDLAKSNARRALGLSFLQGTKNYEAVARSSELDELITLVRSKGERLYLFSMSGLVQDRDLKAVKEKANKLQMQIRECLGAEAITEDFLHKRLFCSTLPLGPQLPPRRHTLTGEACAHLVPLSAPWPGSSSSSGVLLKSREGELVCVDPFEGGTPRHGIVIGSTGSGKSFAMNYLVGSLFVMEPAASFTVIDIGGSYRRLCKALGGDYFELTLSEKFAINPFPERQTLVGEDNSFDPDMLGYLCLLIEKMLEKSDQNKKRIIEAALKELYQSECKEAPLLRDLRTVLEKSGDDPVDRADALEIARALRFYTDGIYGQILNRPSAVRPFVGRFTVFDLAGLKEHKCLQAIIVFLIGFGLGQQMKDRAAKKVVVLDEAWEFFNDPTASELISRLYRTARKFNAAILSVSQSPVDFLKSAASTAMLANSYWKVFLRLDMGHEQLSGFGLNDRQIEAIKSLAMKKRSYSEMLVVFGERSRVLRIQPSSLEYWLATTNAEECAKEAQMTAVRSDDPLSVIKALAKQEPVYAA